MLTTEEVEDNANMKALSLIFMALGDIPLQVSQDCSTAKTVWKKREDRYAARPMVNKLRQEKYLLNTKIRRSLDMVNHISILKSQFVRLAAMQTNIEWPMRVVI